VTEAEDEVLVSKIRIVLHETPQNGFSPMRTRELGTFSVSACNLIPKPLQNRTTSIYIPPFAVYTPTSGIGTMNRPSHLPMYDN
jgi:hypothetical protein